MKDAIRYTVTIKAIVEREETVGKEWTVIGQEMDEATGKPKDVRGYTPETTKTVRRELEIYEQTVDCLDVAAVVSVVNGLTPNAEVCGGPLVGPSERTPI